MKLSEKIAKYCLERLHPGVSFEHSRLESNGEPDFIARSKEGSWPVEVTEIRNQTQVEITKAISDPKKGGPFIPRQLCQKDWYLPTAETASIKRIRKHVDALLADVEATGVDRFFSPTDAADSLPVRRIYTELKIEGGNVTPWKTPGYIALASPSTGGRLDVNELITQLDAALAKPDNKRKLSLGPTPGLLFVCVDHSAYLAWRAVVDMDLNGSKFELPDYARGVHVYAPTREPGEHIVWTKSAAEAWRKDIVEVTEGAAPWS